jgi:rRNA maturation endonuclease Nob1
VERSTQEHDERQLVRCLDCGRVYPLPPGQREADACPECGGVGWVALAATRRAKDGTSS